MEYDDINDLVTKKTYYSSFGDCRDAEVDEITYTYDHQFRMTNKDSKYFDYALYYDGNLLPTFTQNGSMNYNGNINSSTAQFSFPSVLNLPTLFNNGIVYNYDYDDINRLTRADLGYVVGINPGIFGDGAYWYDKIGNLTTMRRGVLTESGQTQIQTQSYNYQSGSNRLLSINECLGGGSSVLNFGNCSGGTAINFTLDQGGNLRSDSKKKIIGIDYHRQNLSWRITKLNTGRDRQIINYLYDAQSLSRIRFGNARIYKKVGRTRGTAEVLEFYLRDVTGDNLGILDITADEWTWYVNGVARESKFKGWGTPEGEGPPTNPSDPGGGGDGPIKSVSARNTYAGTAERQAFQQRDPLLYASILEFKQADTITFPVVLKLIEIEGDTLQQLISQAQLANLNQNYTLIDELQFNDPRDRFLAYEEDASPVILSLLEIMDLPDGWEDPAPPPPGDPFAIPMDTPASDLHPLKSFYIYDHPEACSGQVLGNTRLVYAPDRCAGSFIYTKIEYAADYYPYGKVLREYVGDVREKFLTTQHERDLETDFDYRGARYMDAEYGRFLSVDPLASDYAAWSTYNYVLGNPVMFVDPDGRAPDSTRVYNLNGAYQYTINDDLPNEDHFIADGNSSFTSSGTANDNAGLLRSMSKYFIGKNTRKKIKSIMDLSSKENKERAFVFHLSGKSKELDILDITSSEIPRGENWFNIGMGLKNNIPSSISPLGTGHTHPYNSFASGPKMGKSWGDYNPNMKNKFTGKFGGNPFLIAHKSGITVYSSAQKINDHSNALSFYNYKYVGSMGNWPKIKY